MRELAAIYVATQDRGAITTAANWIERSLIRDPLSVGQPHRKRYRRYFVTPLTVEYKVDDARNEVEIVRVRLGSGAP